MFGRPSHSGCVTRIEKKPVRGVLAHHAPGDASLRGSERVEAATCGKEPGGKKLMRFRSRQQKI
jgi:hypothetical protein